MTLSNVNSPSCLANVRRTLVTTVWRFCALGCLVGAAGRASLRVVSQFTLRDVVVPLDSVGRHEDEQLLRQHQTHDLMDQTTIVPFDSLRLLAFIEPS